MLTEENAVDLPPQLEQIIGVHSAEMLSSEEFVEEVSDPPEWAELRDELYVIKLKMSGVPPNKAIFEVNTVLTNSDSVLQLFKLEDDTVNGQLIYMLHTQNEFPNLSLVR